MIAVRAAGIVYRNPRPELRSHHAWHPSLVRFDDGELVCVFDGASADQALDYRSYTTRSMDGGGTWSPPARTLADWGSRPTTSFVRVGRIRDGSLVGLGARMFRDDPDAGIVNTPGIGYADMELFLIRSLDRGRTWSAPEPVRPPFVDRHGRSAIPSWSLRTAAGWPPFQAGWAGTATPRMA